MLRITAALSALAVLYVSVPDRTLLARQSGYAIAPPEGKLPWPQHNPAFSQAEYDDMLSRLFIINNFGLYQGGDTRDSVYFHDGLDIVLPNGTVLYAISAGIVSAILGVPPYYQTLVIEDADNPGWAWTYTHVRPVKTMKIGARVAQGAPIATIRFQGLEHVHLNRAFLAPGGAWRDFYSHQNVLPDGFFDFRDTEAPVVDTPFYYFLNESYDMLPRGNPTLVSGAIDIVAGVRDVGEYGRASIAQRIIGDRNAPMRLQVSIASAARPDRPIWTHTGIDFSRVVLNWRRPFGGRDPDRVETVFVFKPSIANNVTPSSFYFVTNGSPVDELRPIHQNDGAPAWDTEARDANGRPLFPNGEYVVTVTAWDSHGNVGSAKDRVIVRNQ